MNRWTVDVEADWGGRENSIRGIEAGIPYILDTFEKYGIIGTFFLSTKKLEFYLPIAKEIMYRGHQIGSHGHEHINWRKKHWSSWWVDYKIAQEKIKRLLNVDIDFTNYRAPWFSRQNIGFGNVYDKPTNHISVLKYAWLGGNPKNNTIFYLHPFDIIRTDQKAPNLFCKILYSRPEAVRETFHELVQKFS